MAFYYKKQTIWKKVMKKFDLYQYIYYLCSDFPTNPIF